MIPAKPKKYVIQKHVFANSVEEAISKEAATPIQSVFPDSNNDNDRSVSDAVGFKYVDAAHLYEY